MSLVWERIHDSISTKQKLLSDKETISLIEKVGKTASIVLQNNGKILLCGNGGSAADSLHIAGEIVGRFQKERRALPAIALPADGISLTAISNDYSYDDVFARQTEGLMSPGDMLIGISTSGNSENVYRAILKARKIGGKTVAFLGNDGGKIKDITDMPIIVHSDITARVQESHIMIGHIICEIIEEMLDG